MPYNTFLAFEKLHIQAKFKVFETTNPPHQAKTKTLCSVHEEAIQNLT
jgi:hypothetical protein